MFSSIIKSGIKRIYTEDIESQKKYIDIIMKNVRNMEPDIVYSSDGFFVPNDDYMKFYFGPEILTPSYDCYQPDGRCNWLTYLVFPMYNLIDEVVGLVGFNAINKLKTNEGEEFWGLNYYRHSSSSLVEKSKYIFMPKGTFLKARRDGYIIITDGVFDMLHANAVGLNAGALLGSYVTEEILAQLTFIDKVYLAWDNDEAGEKLYRYMKRRLPNLRSIRHNKGKDLDDLLKSPYKDQFIELFKNNLKSKIPLDVVLM